METDLMIARSRDAIVHNSVFFLDDHKIQVKTIVVSYNTGGHYNVLIGRNPQGQNIWGPYSGHIAALLWGMPDFKSQLLPRLEKRLRQHLSQKVASGQG